MRKSFLTLMAMSIIATGIYADAKDMGVKINGFVRVRPELRQNKNFVESKNPAGAGSDQFVGQKAQVQIGKTFKDGSGIKITLQDSRIWGGEKSAANGLSTGTDATGTGDTYTDMREAYFNWKNVLGYGFDLQLGRQILNYGTQRLVGGLDWTNIGRSWDGIRFKLKTKDNNLHAWSTISSENDNGNVGNNTANSKDVLFNGIYNTYTGLNFVNVDTYYISVLDTTSSTASKLHTFGARFFKSPKKGEMGVDYEAEFAAQTGKTGNLDANNNMINYAGMMAVLKAGYTFQAGMKMRIGGELSIGTGDKASTTDKAETFKNLYPTNHLFYGYADLISLQNAVIGTIVAKVFINKTSNFQIAYIYAAKDVSTDNWYNVGGGNNATLTALVAATSKKQLFHEIDLTYSVKPTDYLAFQAGFSYVMRGSALTDALVNARTDYIFSYISSSVKF